MKTIVIVVTAMLSLSSVLPTHGESVLDRIGVEMHGFIDARGGIRTQNDPDEKESSLGETRLQLDAGYAGDLVTLLVRADLLYDEISSDDELDLEEGTGVVDLREANILVSPLDFADVKIGRQILTWGIGDLLFINDLFPKDWQSFFCGRDVEYLKAPSDAIFVSLFPDIANIDIAYTPRFDPDRNITGGRLSYWNGMLGSRAGRNAIIEPDKPGEWFDADETAIRISRNLSGHELAVYAYDGYWKTPQGVDPTTMSPCYPALTVYGASMRAGLGKGLLNVEAGLYDSCDDRSGNNQFVPNGETRALLGYERELIKNLSAGIQYYLEHMSDYDAYKSGLQIGQDSRDQDRHVATLRITKQALSQNLVMSLFAYYSPTDEDAYIRPLIKYKITDAFLVLAGGNIFFGETPHTFFGQFEKNNNVYGGVRHSF